MARLRRISDGCDRSGEIDWLREALRRYFEGVSDGLRLEDALEVAVPQHAAPWWRVEAISRRDDALRELAEKYYPQPSLAQRAVLVEMAIDRYAGSAWKRDRRRNSCPNNYLGTEFELLFRAFEAHEGMPGGRMLRRILAK